MQTEDAFALREGGGTPPATVRARARADSVGRRRAGGHRGERRDVGRAGSQRAVAIYHLSQA